MSRKLFLIFPLLFASLFSNAQNTLSGGARVELFSSQLRPNPVEFRPKLGLAGGFYLQLQLSKYLGMDIDLQVARHSFYAFNEGEHHSLTAVNLMFGPSLLLNKELHLTTQVLYSPSQGHTGHPYFMERSSLHRSIVPYGGRVSLNFSRSKLSGLGFFYQADRMNVHAVGVRFNLNATHEHLKFDISKEHVEVASSLDSLQATDTLYIVNDACDSNMSIARLAQLFNENFTFCPFIVINVKDVDSVMLQVNPSFYAYVGSYFGGIEEPASTGIYLMDRNFNLTQHPYPVHTAYTGSLFRSETCFSNLENSAQTIKSFNNRLYRRL